MANTTAQATPEKRGNAFGTFGGVFTPSILTILGVIMFLRVGYVIGQSGILNTIIILLMAESIAFLTALSMSAIATNIEVKGGGAYFLISRTLGPQFGGAIGIALYLAQALSIPFYILGFTQALIKSYAWLQPYSMIIALATTFVLFVVNYVGASWAIKTQYIVMTMLALAIAAFIGGAIVQFNTQTFSDNWSSGYTGPELNFWVIFAIYFPAVTGILSGINMSGDLKKPAQSLVRGTLMAIGVGLLIYLTQILICGGSQNRALLIEKPFENLIQNALFGTGFLVIGGAFAATLSSALGSFLGAPRILQAVARDKILPGMTWFAKGTEETDEPRQALVLCCILTIAVIVATAGEDGMQAFDMVASVITMFFLSTYGMINLASFIESFGANPTFRPKFKLYHWTTSLLGALFCLGVMMLINITSALIAVVLIACIYIFISRRSYSTSFGDAWHGLWYSRIAWCFHKLKKTKPHAKNWRPTFLVFSGNPQTRPALVKYSFLLEAGRGLISIAYILEGDFNQLQKRREAILDQMEKMLAKYHFDAFPEVIITNEFSEGLQVLVQSHSIGPIKPNTVLLGWPNEQQHAPSFMNNLRIIRNLRKSVLCVLNPDNLVETKKDKRIDIWWRGMENGSLMGLLAHLLTQNLNWRHTSVRVLRIVEREEGRAPAREALLKLLQSGRIKAEPTVIVSSDDFASVMHRHSADADLVFLGFQPPESQTDEEFYSRFEGLRQGMPPIILVSSSGEADLLA